jgi:hypothetical protein
MECPHFYSWRKTSKYPGMRTCWGGRARTTPEVYITSTAFASQDVQQVFSINSVFCVFHSSSRIILSCLQSSHHISSPFNTSSLSSSSVVLLRKPQHRSNRRLTTITKPLDLPSNTLNMTSHDRVRSLLWETTQQGDTFVPGTASEQSRSERINSTLQAVDQQFPSLSVTQQMGHGPHAKNAPRNGNSADLNGVGQHFQG